MPTLTTSLFAQRASLAPVLLNMNMCFLREDNESLLINYYLDGVEGMRDIAFEELESFQPGLTSTIRDIYKHQNAPQLIDYIRATVGHIAGNYKDLTSIEHARNFPYLTCLKTVNILDNLDSFLIQGLLYKTLGANSHGVPSIKLWGGSAEWLILSGSQMDLIWPRSSKCIPIMAGLGYSPEDMARELQKGLPDPTMVSDANLPASDFTDVNINS